MTHEPNPNTLSKTLGKVLRSTRTLLVVVLIAWGVFAWWSLRQARRAGGVLHDSITAAWPRDSGPHPAARGRLLDAAERIEAGEFHAVVSRLAPARPPTTEERLAAERFFAGARDARDRFLAVASAAQIEEGGGADVGLVRDALARALRAAAKSDRAALDAHVKLAEEALAQLDSFDAPGVVSGDAEAVAALVGRVEPAFLLSRDLMTEGGAVAQKLLARASWHARAGEHRKAASLVNLAAGLLGVESAAPGAAAMPEWFDDLAQSPSESIDGPEAQETVELAEAMALSLSPSEIVAGLVKRARRELERGRPAEAHWWGSLALQAMGMTAESAAQPADAPEPERPQPEPSA